MSISKTRQKLVEVARELFARNGMENTTMNDIAVASGKGRRTLYTYFRNKEDIFFAVIEGELEHLSERMDEVAEMNVEPEAKITNIIYTHLGSIRDVVARNGTLRAEFFRNIWMVEKIRKRFDSEEIAILRRVLQEGVDCGNFEIENVELMAEIIHYSVKGLEVPYIYDRLSRDIPKDETRLIVAKIVRRALAAKDGATSSRPFTE